MNIKIDTYPLRLFFGVQMIFLFILTPLTLGNGTVLITASSEDVCRHRTQLSTGHYGFNAVKMDRQLNLLDRQAKYRNNSNAAQNGILITQQWNRTYGGSAHDGAISIIQTVDGGFAFTIYTEYIIQGFKTGTDAWLVKTDLGGVPQWNRTYGNAGYALAVIQTMDGGFALAGYTEPYEEGFKDVWLVKTDAYGMIQWNRTIGGLTDDWAEALIQTADGGFALIGVTNNFREGSLDAWLVKTDTEGYTQWTLTYGGPADDWAEAIIQTVDGGFAIAGYSESYEAGYNTETDVWLVKTDLRGELQWNRTYGSSGHEYAYTVIQTIDGGFAFTGSTSSYGVGSDDVWLVKTDPRGVVQWNRTYGGSARDGARSFIQTVDGGFTLAGYTESYEFGFKDVWLVKTDNYGVIQWNSTYGGPADDWASAIIQTVDGGFVLAGYTCSYGAGYSDAWLLKLVQILETTLTPPEPPATSIVTTTEVPPLNTFTPEFEGFSVLLTIPFLFWLRRKLIRE